MLFRSDIILTLFGPQWIVAAPIARVLAIGLIPYYVVGLAPNLLAATGHIRARMRISMIYSPVHLVGVLIASFYSLEAVASVWIVSYSVMMLLYMRSLKTVLNCGIGELFLPSLNSAGVALLSVWAQAVVLMACRYVSAPSLVSLVLVGLTAAVSWLGAARLLHHPVFDEVVRLIRPRGATA